MKILCRLESFVDKRAWAEILFIFVFEGKGKHKFQVLKRSNTLDQDHDHSLFSGFETMFPMTATMYERSSQII